ncbi:hypothetical protein B0A48_18463 [Cryoendolithus antarcticus]|uniref:Copper acquisition factor BIM1-like domain-containing protein n=1 Tax=Cryoendolithus antarcticus TaxID=1507870 RepID=A0A1V8S832_9PEZI|nr:hypothetical protein B0A48_18463 [Cryoendolithus antarcticus]
MLSFTVLTLALAGASTAHFVLNWPPTAGFIDDSESNGPCGGAVVTVNSSAPEVQVDRFAIQVLSTHPEGQWQFRATTDTQEPYNWTEIAPLVNTEGAGIFCLNYMSVPSSFAGSKGIIQVTDGSIDGTLYQCAPVSFTSGSNATIGEFCKNQSSTFTASWLSQDSLPVNASESASASGGASSTVASMGGTETASATASAAAASSSAAGAALAITGTGAFVAGLGAIAAGLML